MCSGTMADVLRCERSLWVPRSLRLNAGVVVVCFGAGSLPEPASLLLNSPVPRFNALSEVRYRCWQTQTTSFDTTPLIRANEPSSCAYFQLSYFFFRRRQTIRSFGQKKTKNVVFLSASVKQRRVGTTDTISPWSPIILCIALAYTDLEVEPKWQTGNRATRREGAGAPASFKSDAWKHFRFPVSRNRPNTNRFLWIID